MSTSIQLHYHYHYNYIPIQSLTNMGVRISWPFAVYFVKEEEVLVWTRTCEMLLS